MQWSGATDDPGGSGLAGYSVSHHGYARRRLRWRMAMQQLSFRWNNGVEPRIDPGLQNFVLSVQIQGGYIVSANDCSAEELAQAKADGRFYRSAGDLEYVHRK